MTFLQPLLELFPTTFMLVTTPTWASRGLPRFARNDALANILQSSVMLSESEAS